MTRRLSLALALAGALVFSVQPAAAQDRLQLNLSTSVMNAVVPPAVLTTVGQLPSVPFNPDFREYPRPGRSTLLTSLYASTVAMQALDVHSTLMALNRGATEANPMMSSVTGNPGAFIALKAGVAFSTVMAARHMSKRNKVAAVATLIAVNSAYAMVISHNYRVAQRLR